MGTVEQIMYGTLCRVMHPGKGGGHVKIPITNTVPITKSRLAYVELST
jgi:hypothetical protein